jgi:hypothetical protein
MTAFLDEGQDWQTQSSLVSFLSLIESEEDFNVIFFFYKKKYNFA